MDGGLWLTRYDALDFISFSLSLSPALFLVFVGFVELGANQHVVPPAGWTRRTLKGPDCYARVQDHQLEAQSQDWRSRCHVKFDGQIDDGRRFDLGRS